jgi:hypothetical protein
LIARLKPAFGSIDDYIRHTMSFVG